MFIKRLSLFVLPFVATLSLQANDPFNDPFFQDPFGDDMFKEMKQMQKNMDKMFNRMQNGMQNSLQQRASTLINPTSTHKVALQSLFVDKGTHYEYITSILENKENQIEISAKGGIMTMSAKVIEKQENKSASSYSSSSSMRMYQQSIPLPKDADEGSVKASYINGKLVISLDKNKVSNIIVPNIKTNEQKVKKDTKKVKELNSTQENNSSSIKKMIITSDMPSMS